MKTFLLALWEVMEVVLIAVVTVFVIRTFLAQPFLVSGASMEPNFGSGNYLIIDEITYRFREPERGEVIVFRYPQNPSVFYIKRVIALPNEHITIQSGSVNIKDESGKEFELEEEYLNPVLRTSGSIFKTLGDDEYFVMGDNRNYSFDSRSWGALDKEYIVGLARLRLFPFTEVQAFTY
ncbi:MAG: signal peptidase I [bacterium]|nr:signal peptidase I [bacterium]